MNIAELNTNEVISIHYYLCRTETHYLETWSSDEIVYMNARECMLKVQQSDKESILNLDKDHIMTMLSL